MSIPDIVLEDIYRRLRELEEEVKQLRKAHQVYGPGSPPPVPFPPVVTLPYHPGPSPVWSGGVQLCGYQPDGSYLVNEPTPPRSR